VLLKEKSSSFKHGRGENREVRAAAEAFSRGLEGEAHQATH
jgi:hypothetical protein